MRTTTRRGTAMVATLSVALSMLGAGGAVVAVESATSQVALADDSEVEVDFGKGEETGGGSEEDSSSSKKPETTEKKDDPKAGEEEKPKETSSSGDKDKTEEKKAPSTVSEGGGKAEYAIYWLDKETGIMLYGVAPYKGNVELHGVPYIVPQYTALKSVDDFSGLVMESVTMMGDKLSNATGMSKNIDKAKAKVMSELDKLTENQGKAAVSGGEIKIDDQRKLTAISPYVIELKNSYQTLEKMSGKSDDDIAAFALGAADPRQWKKAYVVNATLAALIPGKYPADISQEAPVVGGSLQKEWADKGMIDLGLKKKETSKAEEPPAEGEKDAGSSGGDESAGGTEGNKGGDDKSTDGGGDSASGMEALKAAVTDATKDTKGLTVAISGLDGDLKDGEQFVEGDDKSAYAASTVKVIIAAAVKDKLKGTDKVNVSGDVIVDGSDGVKGKAGEYTVDQLTKWMIQKSDNTATNALIKKVVGEKDYAAKKFDAINEYSKKAGTDKDFMVANTMMSTTDSKITAAAANTYLTKLAKGDVIDKAKADEIIELMKGQEVKTKIAGVAPKDKYATKTGENTGVSHEIGYLWLDSGMVSFAITGTGDDKDALDKAIQGVGKALFAAKVEKKAEGDDKGSEETPAAGDGEKDSGDSGEESSDPTIEVEDDTEPQSA